MREMDRRLIEAGCVTRATVKWYGGGGQLAHPYLWNDNPTDTECQESWSDPRTEEIQSRQTVSSIPDAESQAQSTNSISEMAQSATDTAADIASALGGIFDISPDTSSYETVEEAEFRRLMQRKKKK